jgi:hypothetical protein
MALQRLQDTDLLRRILERQQEMAERRFGDSDTTQADTTQSSAAQEFPRPADSTRRPSSRLHASR